MLHSLSAIILAILATAPTVATAQDAVLFRCDFEQSHDVNFDRWPDGWKQRLDSAHPAFANIEITTESSASNTASNRVLSIAAAGKFAAIYSPESQADPDFNYVVTGQVKTRDMQHSDIVVSLTFIDDEGKPIATQQSRPLVHSAQWREFEFLSPSPAATSRLLIGLHVDSNHEPDLACTAMFDDVRLVRLPRLRVKSSNAPGVFQDGEHMAITCDVSGVNDDEAIAAIELCDLDGRQLAAVDMRIGDGLPDWPPPLVSPGFYRIRAKLARNGARTIQTETTIAVLRNYQGAQRNQFGWTLPRNDLVWPQSSLGDLFKKANVGWVTLPISLDENSDRNIKRLQTLIDPLSQRGIQTVVDVDDCPADWQPQVDRLVRQLPFTVRWIRPPSRADASAGEFEEYLSQHAPGIRPVRQPWQVIEALPKSAHNLSDRAGDLVRRMIDAKVAGAEVIFLDSLVSDERGLFHQNGTPTELLLPWHTTAQLLSSATYLGAVGLPLGSENRVFLNHGQPVLVAWSNEPRTESIALGENVRQLDVWGRESALPREGEAHLLCVGPVPTFVTGLDEQLVRWSLAFRLQPTRVASIAHQPQAITLHVNNPVDEPVEIHVLLHARGLWRSPKPFDVALPAGAEQSASFTMLPHDLLASGNEIVRIEALISGSQQRRLNVFRTIEVGLDDISLNATTHLAENGDLIVTQELVNNGAEPVSFNCLLFAAGQRRQRVQILDVAAGNHITTYVIPDGDKLVGETLWLEAHEIDGARMLNRRILIQR